MDPALEARLDACYWVRVTVRQAVLPIGAVLVLGLGVYLFIQVRAQSAPPPVERTPRVPRPAIAAVPQAVALHDAPAAVRPSSSDRPAVPAIAPQVPVVSGTPEVIMGSPPERAAAPSGPKLDTIMDEANKAYDRGDFDDAKIIATRVLANDPTNVRMLRIMVSASCQDGDSVVAQAHFSKLPPGDQQQMKVRCARYGITFPAPP
jgi:hypothetical protein